MPSADYTLRVLYTWRHGGAHLQQVVVLVPQRASQRQHRVAGAPVGLRHLLLLVRPGHRQRRLWCRVRSECGIGSGSGSI